MKPTVINGYQVAGADLLALTVDGNDVMHLRLAYGDDAKPLTADQHETINRVVLDALGFATISPTERKPGPDWSADPARMLDIKHRRTIDPTTVMLDAMGGAVLVQVSGIGAEDVAKAITSTAPAALLARAESFISGFEDDEEQEGVPALLADLRAAQAGAPAAFDAEDMDIIKRGVSHIMSFALARDRKEEHAAACHLMGRLSGWTMKDKPDRAQAALDRIAARLRGEWYDPDGDLESDIAGVVRGAGVSVDPGQVADVPAILPDVPVIAVDALAWQEVGEEHQPKARLLAALQIGDCMFHVEAREIDPEADPQSTLEYGDDFDKFGDIADQGDFATMTREGRQYFVFILPYEA